MKAANEGSQCRSGFSLLFYGLGSKRNAINDFAREALTDGGLVIINAWHSPVTAKQIAVATVSALSGQPEAALRCAPLKRIHCAHDALGKHCGTHAAWQVLVWRSVSSGAS
jgi:hypothetical protein